MDNQLKQRLVGAVVLVALAVIFIPMLLPGEGELGGIHGSNIPAEPDFRFPPVPATPKPPPRPKAAKLPVGDDVEPANTPPTPAASPQQSAPPASATPSGKAPSKRVAPAPAKPAATERADTPEAWVVQVGSFAARNNARALRDKLRKQGFASFVESVKGASGRVYRVRVGPELSKAAADKLRQRLAKETDLKGLVHSYP